MWFNGPPAHSRPGSRRWLARPHHRGSGHRENESRASMLSLAVRCTVEDDTSAPCAVCREHRDATPRARTLASTGFVVKYIFRRGCHGRSRSATCTGMLRILPFVACAPQGKRFAQDDKSCLTYSPREARWRCPSASISSSRS